MNKKAYIVPEMNVFHMVAEPVMAAASTLDPEKDNQEITPSDDEYDGEFGSRMGKGIWDDED